MWKAEEGPSLVQRGGRRLFKEDRKIPFTGWALLALDDDEKGRMILYRKVMKTSIFSIHSVLRNVRQRAIRRILCNHYLVS